MASALASTASNTVEVPKPTLTGFRLGEDNLCNASDSDSDQSAHSERSVSPSKTKGQKSKSKKKKERKQVGALTDELGTLLGDAFKTPNDDGLATGTASGIAEQVPTMEVDMTPAEQKLSKRTRQNMAKMEKRKARHDQWLQDRDARRSMSSQGNGVQKQQKKKNPAVARREKKERQRAKKSAAQGDAMEIG